MKKVKTASFCNSYVIGNNTRKSLSKFYGKEKEVLMLNNKVKQDACEAFTLVFE